MPHVSSSGLLTSFFTSQPMDGITPRPSSVTDTPQLPAMSRPSKSLTLPLVTMKGHSTNPVRPSVSSLSALLPVRFAVFVVVVGEEAGKPACYAPQSRAVALNSHHAAPPVLVRVALICGKQLLEDGAELVQPPVEVESWALSARASSRAVASSRPACRAR